MCVDASVEVEVGVEVGVEVDVEDEGVCARKRQNRGHDKIG
jgi:hypothetical protein